MRICLDAGHGGEQDPGLVFHGVREKDICLAIVNFLNYRLAPQHRVHLTRWGDFQVSIIERCAIANAAASDIFVSIVGNAMAEGEACGAEIWIYPGSVKAKHLAEKIANEFRTMFPDEPWRGIHERDLGVLHFTRMPAVLVEVGCIDASATSRLLRNPETEAQIAVAIAAGVDEYAASMVLHA